MGTDDMLDVRIPDTAMAHEARELVRGVQSESMFRHSTRVYFWAALLGRRRNLAFDAELLYTAAMFHDVGLTERFGGSQLRFEVDGANAARDFLRRHGVGEPEVARAWAAIALHTTPGIPEHLDPEIALIQAGAGLDVVGRGYEQLTDRQREAVIAAYPRGAGFEREMIDTFYEGLKHRPDSTYGTFNDDILAFKDPTFRRKDYCSVILHSPWVLERGGAAPA